MPDTPAEWTVLSMMEWATTYFEQKNIPGPRLSVEWLLAEVLGVRRLDLYLMYDRPLAHEELDTLRPLIKRRAAHEPLQYITGSTDFYSVTIEVEPGVLIPRPETEELVELAIREVKSRGAIHLLDVGTGSGCIAVALKKELPECEVTAADISEKALTVAKRNAQLNDTSIRFLQADLYDVDKWDIPIPLDLIISNPPYIGHNEKEAMEKQVKDHEPPEALFCTDVTGVYRSLNMLAHRLLGPSGVFMAEINPLYAQQILDLFEGDQWEAGLRNDLSGKQRFLVAKKIP